MTGPSNPPDPDHHAYRKDLADIALAGRVLASHYAEPMARLLTRAAALRSDASDQSEAVCELKAGDAFEMLENSVGWAWGYGGKSRRVGYVEADALAPA